MRLKKEKNIEIQWLKYLEKKLKFDLSKNEIMDKVFSNKINVNIVTKNSWLGIILWPSVKIIKLFVRNKKEKKGICSILM